MSVMIANTDPGIGPVEFLRLAEEESTYGVDLVTRPMLYEFEVRIGLRRGQAFMNALRGTEYYDKLTGSLYDPFYKDNVHAIDEAIDWLMS